MPSTPEVKDARLRMNLTQAELAGCLGVSRVAVANWERGAKPVPPYLIRALRDLERERKHMTDRKRVDEAVTAAVSGRRGPKKLRVSAGGIPDEAEEQRHMPEINAQMLDEFLASIEHDGN